jgi:minor extracellular serine protease Vpr
LRTGRVGQPAGRGRRSRRTTWFLSLTAVAAALIAVSAAGAARIPVPGGSVAVQGAPLGLGNHQATVVVQLAADPITVADANAAAPLSDSQKQTIRDQLRSQQAPVENEVRSYGGKILASYQASYNGFKVSISASNAAQLASLPGVVAVYPLELVQPSNIHGIPLIGAPQVWDGLNGLHGEGIKIADIDTGIDYTHADFGGSGNPADYQTALASDTLPANPLWFGPSAPKVKGGIDLVGDTYQPDPTAANYQPTPQPDPNPLDCNSHGTHTAGTMAGFGVLGNGQTYTGPYNATTVSSNNWLVGPGVAPKADIYSVKVFGCNGPTNEVIDAIEWAVDNNMDVINMSLGSPFGSPDSPDAVAAENAAHDGVIVVASSGNEGTNAYMTGDPASGDNVISVAANDPTPSFPAAVMSLTPGGSVTAINANGWSPLPSGAQHVRVIYTDLTHSTVSLGCSVAADTAEGPIAPNTFIVVGRGTCARVAKAIFGQQAGAAGVIMINNAAGYPPYEGPITQDPDPPGPPLFGGFSYTVTIPFLGVPIGQGPTLVAADGGTVSLVGSTIANPGFETLASFSSWGPRSGDSFLKPNVTAPGVSIFSAGMGTGTGPLNDSGTSMAAPHVTGTAALVKQAHPNWRRVKYWDAAIENTADPAGVADYSTHGAGTGLVQALPAVQTQVVALGDNDMGVVNFGYTELNRDFNGTEDVKLTNFGNSWATFNVADTLDQGSPHSISTYGSTVSVPPHGDRTIHVRLSVPVATAGGPSLPGVTDFSDVAGLLQFTPVSGSNNNVTLRVPYYLVPAAISNVQTRVDNGKISKTHTATAVTTNYRAAVAGSANWFAWGIKDKRDHGLKSNDLQAVGVQSFPSQQFLQFAISTNHRWSNAAQDIFDVLVDVNNDGVPDYDVEAVDLGAVQGLDFNGTDAVAVFALASGAGTINYLADAPTDSSTMLLPVDFAQLCVPGNPCLSSTGHFTYSAQALSLTDSTLDTSDMSATFNPNSSAVNTGMFDELAPNASATEALTVNPTEQAVSPALGWMVVSHWEPFDNLFGDSSRDQVQLIPLNLGHDGGHH